MAQAASYYSGATSLSKPTLEWAGSSKIQLDFMHEVYRLCYEKSARGGKMPVSAKDLVLVDKTHQMHKDAAAAFLAMEKDVEAAALAEGVKLEVGVTSAYRSPDHQLRLWESYFPKYYKRTAGARSKAKGGPHGAAAALILRDHIRTYIATPGFSNHQRGIAVDLLNRQDGKVFANDSNGAAQAQWKASWLHKWLVKNAADYGFSPYNKEAWHWNYLGVKSAGKSIYGSAMGKMKDLISQPEELAEYLHREVSSANMTELLRELSGLTGGKAFKHRAMEEMRYAPNQGAAPVPTVITRASWNAKPFKGKPSKLGPVRELVVHHTAGKEATTVTGKQGVRDVQHGHMSSKTMKDGSVKKGWQDIGYHFLIDSDGNIYQGRPFLNGTTFGRKVQLAKGAHNVSLNTGQIGISLMGCFDSKDKTCKNRTNKMPTTAALNALVSMLDFLTDLYSLDASTDIKAHRDYNETPRYNRGVKFFKTTVCPGDNLYEKMPALRRRVKQLAANRARFVPGP